MPTDDALPRDASHSYESRQTPEEGADGIREGSQGRQAARGDREGQTGAGPPRGGGREFVRGLGACGISMVVHGLLFVVLAVLVLDDPIREELRTLVAAVLDPSSPEDRPVELELSEEVDAVTERTLAVFNASPSAGLDGQASASGTPRLDQRLVERVAATEFVIEAPTVGIPDSVELIQAMPDGDVKGEPRDIVGDYQQAMDRLAQEIVWLLDQGPVLLVWLFDQSNSMKDDQREVRDRIENVYDQLGIVGTDHSDALLTSVASFGLEFQLHTAKPTSNRTLIRQAIDSIPIDPTGRERTCQAIGQTIRLHRRFTAAGRQLVLVVVTDESGQPEDNDRFLESAIAEAKAAGCKIYVLGREAVFGYPYAFVRWRHPQTRRMHWLEIDRGPETAFPEQLQTNGLRRRGDAFSSGFGPYAQARLARETNGIFFMLPSVEDDLVGKQHRYRYDLEAMRPFLPDLRARIEVVGDRDEHPLRSVIWQVITDLNPYHPEARRVVELDDRFPLRHDQLLTRVRENQIKAKLLLKYMAEADRVLEQAESLRQQEARPRWQANYDLMRAQLIAYQARTYEYGVGLEAFLNNYPIEAAKYPLHRGELVLHRWQLGLQKTTLTEESRPYIERANDMFARIRDAYQGTPWAARAQWELRRGYGVTLRPYYDQAWVDVANPMPLPKL